MPGIDFSGDEAARLACIPYTTLDRWLRAQVVPRDAPAEDTDRRRRFTYRDVVLVTLRAHAARPRPVHDSHQPDPPPRSRQLGRR